jgi:hypothetical protein
MGEQKKEQGSVESRQIQNEAKITANEMIKALIDADKVSGTGTDAKDLIPDHSLEEKMTKKPPKVFISYSYDTPKHEKWVEDLATRLRHDGVDIMLDKWDFKMGKPNGAQMNRAIVEPDRVLCICTDEYVRRVDKEEGGAGYEGFLINTELVRNAGTDKFIPVIRNVKGEQKTPKCLDGRGRVDLSDGPGYEKEYERLLRDLHDAVEKPPLGENPFVKGTPSANKILNEPFIADAEEDKLNYARHLEYNKDYKPTWATQLTSLDQETKHNRVAYALSQSEKGVRLVNKTVSNMMTEAERLLEDLKPNSIELTISHNSHTDLEIRGPEGRNLRFYFINRANNSLDGSRLFAEIIRLGGRRPDQPFECTEEMEFTPIIDSNGDVYWRYGDSKKPLDNSAVLSSVFERFVDILKIDRSSRRKKGFLW